MVKTEHEPVVSRLDYYIWRYLELKRYSSKSVQSYEVQMNPVWMRKLRHPSKASDSSQNSKLLTVRYTVRILNVKSNFAFQASCVD